MFFALLLTAALAQAATPGDQAEAQAEPAPTEPSGANEAPQAAEPAAPAPVDVEPKPLDEPVQAQKIMVQGEYRVEQLLDYLHQVMPDRFATQGTPAGSLVLHCPGAAAEDVETLTVMALRGLGHEVSREAGAWQVTPTLAAVGRTLHAACLASDSPVEHAAALQAKAEAGSGTVLVVGAEQVVEAAREQLEVRSPPPADTGF